MSVPVKKTIAPQEDGLEAAFMQFSRCSEELVATYALLQEQVARLSQELEGAREARQRESREKERLALRLKGLQEQLSQQQRLSAIGEMMAQLAHQIRTPLTAARLSVGCLRSSNSTAQRERASDRIEAQLLSLESLVNELLNLAGNGEVDENSIAIDELLSVVSVISEQRYGDALTLNTHAAPDLRVRGNAELLGSALDNLIGNALRAAGGEVSMQIDAREEGDEVALCVTDSGPGVERSLREKIFDPFFSTSGGTGLGLTAVQSILRAHGGGIACVDAERGARFDIRLPRERRMLLSGPHTGSTANKE